MDLQNDFCFETNFRISAYMCGAKKFKSSPHQGEIHWPLWDTTRFPLHLGDSWIMLASQKLSLFIIHFCITIIIIQKEPHLLNWKYQTVDTAVTCVAGVERGRGNLGVRESVWGVRGGKERKLPFPLVRAQIPPFPSPFNAGHAG